VNAYQIRAEQNRDECGHYEVEISVVALLGHFVEFSRNEGDF
jgi:hypothetical protein